MDRFATALRAPQIMEFLPPLFIVRAFDLFIAFKMLKSISRNLTKTNIYFFTEISKLQWSDNGNDAKARYKGNKPQITKHILPV